MPERKNIGQMCYIQRSSRAELVSFDDSIQVSITAEEYKILSYFIDNANRPVSLDNLAGYVWGWNYDKDPTNLKSNISRIRGKLDQIRPGLKRCIETNHGFQTYTLITKDLVEQRNLNIEQLFA